MQVAPNTHVSAHQTDMTTWHVLHAAQAAAYCQCSYKMGILASERLCHFVDAKQLTATASNHLR